MSNEDQGSPELPSVAQLEGFVDRIDWDGGKNKEHLKGIIAMVREGMPREWEENHRKSLLWYRGKENNDQGVGSELPEELEIERMPARKHPDEYHWLESAVITAFNAGYLSEKDEARTRMLLARAA